MHFLNIYSPGGHFSTERNSLSSFGRGSPKEHFCKTISKSMHWLRKRSRLKGFSILSSGGHLVKRSGTV